MSSPRFRPRSALPARAISAFGRLALVLSLLLSVSHIVSPAEAELPATPRISTEPGQWEIADDQGWDVADGAYRIRPLAEYDVSARVLSARSYDGDRESDVAPIDLALGWGPMADRDMLKQLTVSQDDRWYYVRWRNAPIDAAEVIAHSANTHTLPANEEVARQLASVQQGDVVHLRGKLVTVEADDGWLWTSSMTRFDTGDGSCEVLWVESIEVETDDPIVYANHN